MRKASRNGEPGRAGDGRKGGERATPLLPPSSPASLTTHAHPAAFHSALCIMRCHVVPRGMRSEVLHEREKQTKGRAKGDGTASLARSSSVTTPQMAPEPHRCFIGASVGDRLAYPVDAPSREASCRIFVAGSSASPDIAQCGLACFDRYLRVDGLRSPGEMTPAGSRFRIEATSR